MPRKTLGTNQPRFPYTTLPTALRKLLKEIPKRPKPPKMSMDTIKSWGISANNNARTAINVLKKVGLLSSGGEPTDAYTDYMKPGSGPKVLAQKLRETYRIIFENSHSPQTESDDALRSLFNIHSGGGEETIRLQIQTFKALCEHADWSGPAGVTGSNGQPAALPPTGDSKPFTLPPVQVDLHIHLPENKTTRDYEAIIQDIAKYIYGRTELGRG